MKRLKEFLATDDKPRVKSNFAQIASAIVALVALVGIYVQCILDGSMPSEQVRGRYTCPIAKPRYSIPSLPDQIIST